MLITKPRIALATALACSLASVAFSQTATTSQAQAKPDARRAAKQSRTLKAPPSKTAAMPSSKGGVVVFIDPVTGQIRQPDAAEIGSLTGTSAASSGQQAAAPQDAAPQTIIGPGNAVGIVLDESTLSYMVVSKTLDGKLDMDCVTGDKAANKRVQGAQTPVKKEALDVK